MNNGLRLTGFLCTVFLLVGCSGETRTTMDTRTYHGAFNMIISEVDNMNLDVNSEHYTGQNSPVEDQLGSAIYSFLNQEDVKGTPIEAEAQKLADYEQEMLKIWKSSDGSVEKIREVAKKMVDQVEHIKTLI